jgi:tetratricopeptide (TPR) repeat protein
MRKSLITSIASEVFLAVVLIVSMPQGLQARPERMATTAPATRPATRPATQPATQPADALDAARKLFLKGDYAGAERLYAKALTEKKSRISAAIGQARALGSQGKYALAKKALIAISDTAGDDPKWRTAAAVALSQLGEYADALKHATKAHKLRPDWAPAILIRGRLLETLGRKAQAKTVYDSMSIVVSNSAYRKNAEQLVAVGLILDRYVILTGQKASGQADNIFNNYIRRAYEEVDSRYWPAHVAAGMFALSKHRAKTAVTEFRLALKQNPRCADAMVGLGAGALSSWRFETCIKYSDSALKINPNHADALLLKAVCMMQWRKFDMVEPFIKKVLKTNPNHLEALSLGAALQTRRWKPDLAKPYIAAAAKVNDHYSGMPNTIGQWLAAGRQFKQAEIHYLKAIELAPELAGPVTNLGLLYMQTGEEDKAFKTLKKAHELDDFRADVVNYLKILDKLEKFLVKETDHFIIKVDGRYDAVLLDLVADYMEEIYEEICDDFDHQPPGKTIIEFFPVHSEFSVRLAGKGWVGTIGASTGKVIVMVAPNKKRSPQFGTFNWSTVLRHEYTHSVTLSATDNRIPHWFTESCAVWEQPDRRNYDAVRLLVATTRRGKLFPVEELDWGFIRPKRRTDRSLAYAQAEWIMEYIIETRKYPTILAMLKGFRDGLTQKEVFSKILKTTEKQFNKDFAVWAKKQITQWGYPSDPPPDLRKAQAQLAAAKKSGDKKAQADAQAKVAVAWYYSPMPGGTKYAKAHAAAQAALKLNPEQVKALAVVALYQLSKKKHDDAIKTANKLESLNHKSRTAPRVLAECYLAKRNWPQAISSLELLKQRMPLDPWPYEQLAGKYVQMGQPKKALPNLIELHRRTLKDPKYARQIADICLAAEDDAQALQYFKQIVRINPYEASAYEAMASIHRSAGHYNKAIAAIASVCLLEKDSADAWTKMAMMRYLAGRANRSIEELQRADKAADKALAIDSGSQARRVKLMIAAAMESIKEDS